MQCIDRGKDSFCDSGLITSLPSKERDGSVQRAGRNIKTVVLKVKEIFQEGERR